MRYFRRSGPSQLVQDGDGLKRFIEGPDPETQTPGGIIAYDDTNPLQARFAEQISRTPGWYEVDQTGHPIFPEKTAPPSLEADDARARASRTDETKTDEAPGGPLGDVPKDIDEPATAD